MLILYSDFGLQIKIINILPNPQDIEKYSIRIRKIYVKMTLLKQIKTELTEL